MTGSVYAVLLLAVATSLLVAMVLPAPTRAAGNEHGLQLALIGGGATAAIAMGVLALLDLSSASTISAVVACLFVAPCAWLARAPRPADGWLEDEEDDDDSGSPGPHHPAGPPVPDDDLPGVRPACTYTAPAAPWAPAQPAPAAATATLAAPAPPAPVAPVSATAARVQRLIADQAAERSRAESEAQRLLAAAALVQLAEAEPAPESAARKPSGRPRPVRPRADHPSVAHVMAANAHGSLRHRAPATRRGVSADPRPVSRD
jgi:hypothetical protein